MQGKQASRGRIIWQSFTLLLSSQIPPQRQLQHPGYGPIIFDHQYLTTLFASLVFHGVPNPR